MNVRRSAFGRVVSRAALVAALASAFVLSPPSTAAASACSTTTTSTYSVQLCLSPSGGTVTGSKAVTATATLATTTVRVSYVTFCLDGSVSTSPSCLDGGAGYLLRDFNASSQPSQTVSTWKFTLHSTHWVDGTHVLTAVATMRDGTRSSPVGVSLAFSNGKTSQPVNNAKPATSGASGTVVAAVGDAGGGESVSKTVGTMVSGWSPARFLYLGDVYANGSYEEFANWYASEFGSLKSKTRPVIGNHEYLSASDPATSTSVVPAHTAYFDYWNNIPDYYSFDVGGWHFIALNSNSTPMTTTKWKAELSWLSSDLSAHAGACTIAYFHHPAFNVGTEPVPGSSTTLWSALAGKATLVLNGHDHTYQRWRPMDAAGTVTAAGTTEIVVGTGGHALGTFATTDSRVVSRSTSAGALKLTLSSASVATQFLNSSGTLVDGATIPCV